LIRFIIKYQEIEINTAIKDQIIHFLAFFVFSSSPAENIYINPAAINAITATTATYLISSETNFHINVNASEPSAPHQGNHSHSMFGSVAKTELIYN
jgi:hypothetical protein